MTPPSLFSALDQHAVTIEPLLRRLLERCAADATFRADLDRCGFQPYPSPSDEIDCFNPWVFVIAMNGCGSAYGLYVHPDVARGGVAPWVYWEHEDDSVVFLADDTDGFLRGLLALSAGLADDPRARLHAALTELGVDLDGAPVEFRFDDRDASVAWLPPARDQLEEVAAYVDRLATDPSAAERGLLGRCQFLDDRAARAVLDGLYAARGVTPPRSCDD